MQAEAKVVLTQLNLEPLGTARSADGAATRFAAEYRPRPAAGQTGDDHSSFPVTGDIRSPEVGIAAILRTAFVKAMRGATLSYLTNLGATALGAPVGASLIAKRLFEHFTALRFRPVSFPPAVAELDPASTNYLQEIATKLQDRSEVNIILCGVATPADAAALPQRPTEDELRQLAQLRAATSRRRWCNLASTPAVWSSARRSIWRRKAMAPGSRWGFNVFFADMTEKM